MKIVFALLAALAISVAAVAKADQPPDQFAYMTTYCKGAKTQYDMTMCAGKYAEAAQAKLNATWQAVLKTWQNHPLVIQRLRESQRQWQRYRATEIAAQQAFYDEEVIEANREHQPVWLGTDKPASDATFQASLDESRASWLCNWLRGVWGGERNSHPCEDLVRDPFVMPGFEQSVG